MRLGKMAYQLGCTWKMERLRFPHSRNKGVQDRVKGFMNNIRKYGILKFETIYLIG